jgi:hypothetical protein
LSIVSPNPRTNGRNLTHRESMKDQLAFRGKSRSEIVEPSFALASRSPNGAAFGGAPPGDASPGGAATRPGPAGAEDGQRGAPAGAADEQRVPRVRRTGGASRRATNGWRGPLVPRESLVLGRGMVWWSLMGESGV